MQPDFPLSVTTDDGGSAHTASSTDALSSDIICFTIWAGRNRKRFPAHAFRFSKKLCLLCKHKAFAFHSPVPALFPESHVMSSFTGRCPKDMCA